MENKVLPDNTPNFAFINFVMARDVRIISYEASAQLQEHEAIMRKGHEDLIKLVDNK